MCGGGGGGDVGGLIIFAGQIQFCVKLRRIKQQINKRKDTGKNGGLASQIG